MYIGARIIFDQDGDIVSLSSEVEYGAMPRKENIVLDYIDLEFGSINYSKYRIVGVDTATRQPILEEIPQHKTPEQQLIEELENQLLLATDNEVGGIL